MVKRITSQNATKEGCFACSRTNKYFTFVVTAICHLGRRPGNYATCEVDGKGKVWEQQGQRLHKANVEGAQVVLGFCDDTSILFHSILLLFVFLFR